MLTPTILPEETQRCRSPSARPNSRGATTRRIVLAFAVGSVTAFYWLLAPFFVEAQFRLTRVDLIFFAVGWFRLVFTINLALSGTDYLGPTLWSTLSPTAPLFGLMLGPSVFHRR